MENIVYKTIPEYIETYSWHSYSENHPLMNLANNYLSDISPSQFWAASEQYPDLVKHLQQQTHAAIWSQWRSTMVLIHCFICKSGTEDFNYFAVNCPNFRELFESLWSNLKITSSVPILRMDPPLPVL